MNGLYDTLDVFVDSEQERLSLSIPNFSNKLIEKKTNVIFFYLLPENKRSSSFLNSISINFGFMSISSDSIF